MRRFFKGLAATVLGVICLLPAGCGSRTADGCLVKAKEYADSEEWKEALKQARRAVELEPDNVSGLVFRAVASEKCGERDLALDSALQAVKINPESFAAQYTLGRIYASDPARYADAMNALEQALRLKPDDTNTLVALCNVAVAMRSRQAVPYLLMLKQRPEFAKNPALDNQLGISYVRSGNFNAAKRAFMDACRNSKNNPGMLYNMGVFMDRYTSSKANARGFYKFFLKQTQGKPEYAAARARVEARLRQMN